ncbi:DNA polymerase III subunit chi [Roseinatronobacter alkalisoli]|uniref:DNA polymerase III subunit chi n=1 Tax=Roseinatronobacter alkalisoli TaxID=3028235 RepID=A0ABT5T7Y8_9RHOB|nr:DNA polymerase III subunit chi [Roseinatronobacter sp. HJB301]MDD7970307.1 DNA polymerase III subunit chi [Roseinatronobacter sp. HJB301]
MGKVIFYHLTRNPLEVTAHMLLDRAHQAGWRVTVRGRDPAVLARLDETLWLGDKAGFLPHGLAGGAHDADQPILLTQDHACPNNPACLMVIDMADATPQDADGLERLWILFDGNDAAATDHARAQWKAVKAAGMPAEYWSEESGRWQMKAQSGS